MLMLSCTCRRSKTTRAITGLSLDTFLIVSSHHAIFRLYHRSNRTSFIATDGGGGAGLSYIRVPLGASDFSASCQSYVSSRAY